MSAMGKKIVFLLGVAVVLLSCNLPTKAAPTSLPPEVIATSVALTANALIVSPTARAATLTSASPNPSETPTSTPTPTPPPPTATPTSTPPPPTLTPSPQPFRCSFWADNTSIFQGACTNLHWDVEGVQAVYLDGAGVTAHSTKRVCPGSTHTYTLHMVKLDGSTADRQITIKVMPKINILPTPGFSNIPLPDLVVESFTHSPNPKCNNVYTVYFTVKNAGTLASGSFKVRVFFGSNPNPIEEDNISNLNAGASWSKSFMGSAGCQSPATMHYRIVVDPDNSVAESNENNNSKDLDVQVTP